MRRCLGLLSCSVAVGALAIVAAAGVAEGASLAAPTVVTGAVVSPGQVSATLKASVNPNGSAVSECGFEYGITSSYGRTVPCSSSPGAASGPVSVSASLTGLTPNTTYHFRILATNAGGTSEGSDETFRTVVACAGATTTLTTTITTTTTSAPGSPPPAAGSCWEEIQPYPFGSLGGPVEASSDPSCVGLRNPEEACYLTVTSMAFRAWNRGLASTTELGGSSNQPFGVWLFNGSHWYPDPGFPGSKSCKGNTIAWAGNLDYWLVGSGEDNWPSLCRFNGHLNEWGSLELPKATKEHVAETIEEVNGERIVTKLKPGGITSASCFAWNDCWFFGTYGTVVHWNGTKLIDASPELSQTLLQGEYTGAAARHGPAGEPIGLAVSATSETSVLGPLSTVEGIFPAQLYGSGGENFSPLPFAPPTTAQPGDPFRTDLVAVDLDPAGQGWVAGNPAGLRLTEREGKEPRQQDPTPPTREFSAQAPQPAPLVPVSTSGPTSGCPGPPAARFSYTPFTEATAKPEATSPGGSFLWSSISVIPADGEALAGGHMRRSKAEELQEPAASDPNDDASVGEPVIAQADCEGTTTLTRFRIPDPAHAGALAPADRKGGVTAIAANATNDAWAATSRGVLAPEIVEPPHLYRLTNGQPPAAPEGNDQEVERELTTEHPTHFVFEAPKPEPPLEYPAVAEVAPFIHKPPSATYAVKAKVHTVKKKGHVYIYLYLSFKLRRPVTIGAQALLRGHVVSEARPKHFKGRSGLLILQLERSHWPSKIRFIA